MQHIFSFGLATGKHAMGSGEPLGSPMPDFPGTPDVEILDGPDGDGGGDADDDDDDDVHFV